MYREAIFVASTYAKNYYTEALSLEELQTQLKAVDTYVSAPVWIIDTDGTNLLNSREKLNLENPKVLTDSIPHLPAINIIASVIFMTVIRRKF